MINLKYFRFDLKEIHHLYYGLGLMWLSQILSVQQSRIVDGLLYFVLSNVIALNPKNKISLGQLVFYSIIITGCIFAFSKQSLLFLGAAIALDDLVQHIKQGYGLYGYSYQSWAASQFNWIYGTEWWKELVSKFKWLKND